jgi:hypothetical protein
VEPEALQQGARLLISHNLAIEIFLFESQTNLGLYRGPGLELGGGEKQCHQAPWKMRDDRELLPPTNTVA